MMLLRHDAASDTYTNIRHSSDTTLTYINRLIGQYRRTTAGNMIPPATEYTVISGARSGTQQVIR